MESFSLIRRPPFGLWSSRPQRPCEARPAEKKASSESRAEARASEEVKGVGARGAARKTRHEGRVRITCDEVPGICE